MTAPTLAELELAGQVPMFNGLKPEALNVLLSEARVIKLRPGRGLFCQGEPANAFFVIVDGWVKLYRITPAGDEAVLNVLTKGESFADAVAFTAGRYPATASAVTPARIMVIPADHVLNCAREMPDVAIAMIASTSQHLHRLVQQIEQLMSHSATQRVAVFLASLAPTTRGPCKIKLPYDKSLIAGRLGLKPESLSRVFARLRSLGVEVRASTVEVRDMGQLCKLVNCGRLSTESCPVRPRLACGVPPARQPEAKSEMAGAGS
jgi:CRP-like cAMP-binding protein